MSQLLLRSVDDLTPELLSTLVGELRPGTAIEAVEIKAVRGYGDADTATSVSTSSQIALEVRYNRHGGAPLPERLLAKMSFPEGIECSNPFLDPLFENEVLFYNKLRPELVLETPLGLGARFDPDSKRFLLLMEDLTPRTPHINSMIDDDDLPVVRAILETYARLHAHFWQSKRFGAELAWLQSQVSGTIEDMFDGSIRQHVINELAREKFKREFAEEYGMSEAEMYEGEKALKRLFDTRPQTVLHGDAHFANTYALPDGTGGLLDWQVSQRGYALFDVSYFIQTALSVEGRRRHERDLLTFYRESLRRFGVVDLPDMEAMWLDYRRAMHHGFYLGWLTAPRENYGWEVMVLGCSRTRAACLDHGSAKLIADLH